MQFLFLSSRKKAAEGLVLIYNASLLPVGPFPVLTGTGDPSFPVVPLHTVFNAGHSDTSATAGHNDSFRMHTDILEATYSPGSRDTVCLGKNLLF